MRRCVRRLGSAGGVKFGALTRGLGESTRRRLSGPSPGKIDSRARFRSAAMPSVGGMRRTRVFGLVKGVDGARVLRSGRLLWLESGEGKPKKPVEDGLAKPNNNSFKSTKNYSGANFPVKGKENGWDHNSKSKQEQAVPSKANSAVPAQVLRSSSMSAVNRERKMFGTVYTRKRKRGVGSDGFLVPERRDLSGDTMYGIQFSRRQRRKGEQQRCFSVVLESFSSCNGFRQFLFSVLLYTKRVGLRLSLLAAFLLSEPVCSAFGSVGIRFMWDPPMDRTGVCLLFGAFQLVPLFSVDFSCIPSCFLYMHLPLVFRVRSLSLGRVNNSLDDDDEDEHFYECPGDSEVDKSSIQVKSDSYRKASLREADASRSKVAHPSVRASKLVGRSSQLRNGIGSRGIRKTRSSMRRRRAGNHIVGMQNAGGNIVIGLAHSCKSSVSRPAIPKKASRSPVTTGSAANVKKPRFIKSDMETVNSRSTFAKLVKYSAKSTPAASKLSQDSVKSNPALDELAQNSVKSNLAFVELAQNSVKSNPALVELIQNSVKSNPALVDSPPDSVKSSPSLVKSAPDSVKSSSSCSANLLVVEADRCYRIAGVTIVQEMSNSSEWVLAMKKDDRTLYSHLAQKSMKPCSFNRVTHDVIWSTDETWKLEFPYRQDWLIFKDLYKECSDRNVPATTPKVIPVPGVREVPQYEDTCSASFRRPDSYISVKRDEVYRALARKSANYDMDSEDEKWLSSFNDESLAENKDQDILSEDKFELMIDTFEKVIYCNPDEFTDEKAAASHCKEIARKEVVEAVYSYWMKKRKQKRSALLQVFQGQQPKRAPVIPKPAFRKKRSFKRQPSLFGRGKQPSLLQAMAAEQDAQQGPSAAQKVEEAKELARRCTESAIAKRQRAQLLMENADLAVYKAVMALKIAKAASCTGVADVTAIHSVDWQM